MAWASAVTGFTFTQACSQPGNVPVATNTLLPKVNGNMMMNPKPCTACGVLTYMPSSAQTQHKPNANVMIRSTPASASHALVCTRKPSSEPYANSTANEAT